MSDVELLLDAFASGELLRPSADKLNIVDLSNAIASLAGIADAHLTSGAKKIKELIGSPDHLVLVLSDGLGMHFLDAMNNADFLPQHLAAELFTVFPSTTPTVLTSLTTGLWPARHAITGWDMYLPELGDIATIIRYFRRSDERPLSQLNITPNQAYPTPSLFNGIERNALTLLPDYIVKSAFSNYFAGKSAQMGYKKLDHAISAIISRVTRGNHPTFTYLYTPIVDSNAHEFGIGHKNTLAAARKVSRELQRLASKLPDSARIVMTADHGLVDSSPNELHLLGRSDSLLTYLNHEPSGDGRAMYFDVKDGAMSVFVQQFKARFGNRFALISTSEMEGLGLFGPDHVTPLTRCRLGNVASIPIGADRLTHSFGVQKDKKPMVGGHGGLSPNELRIPLVVV